MPAASRASATARLVASDMPALRSSLSQPRLEAQRPAAVDAVQLLLGELDARRVAALLGAPRCAAASSANSGGRSSRPHRLVGQLGPAAHDRPLDAVEARRSPSGSTRTVNTTAGRGPSGSRLAAPSDSAAGYSRARSSGRYTVTPRCHASRSSGSPARDEEPDVGDGVVQHDVVAGALEGERLVEVGRPGRVERDERPVGAIDVVRAGRPRGRLHRGQRRLRREPGRHPELLPDPDEPGVERPIDVPRTRIPLHPSVAPSECLCAPSPALDGAHSMAQRRAPMNMPLSAS